MTTAIALQIGANDQASKVMAVVEARINAFASKSQASMDRAAGSFSKGMNATSGAIDKVTARFDAINKRAEAALAPIRKVQASLEKLRDASGLNRIAGGFGRIARSGGDAYQKIGQLVPLIGIITGAASIAGITGMVNRWGQWGLKISQVSRQIGVGSRDLAGWQGAASLAGSSANAMTGGLQNLGQSMYDAVGGRNSEAIVMFRTLGVTFQDGAGHARQAADVLPEIADKLTEIRDPFARAQVGVTLFGGAWQELEPLLMLGSKRIKELQATAERYNFVTPKGIRDAKDLALAQRELGLSVGGLETRISQTLAPVLTPMLHQFSEWLATSPNVTRGITWLGDAVKKLGEWIESIYWDKVGAQMDAWGERVKKLLAIAVKLGLLPDLSDIGGPSKPGATPNTSPTGTGFGENGQPTAPPPKAGTENNGWTNWGRNIGTEWNPLHWTPWYHPPMAPGANAPNGVPKAGPRFGPQNMPPPGQAPGTLGNNPQANPSPADAAYKPLMDFVAKTEGTDRGRGYNETLGYGQWTGGDVDLTHMTLDQVDKLQQSMLDKQGKNPNRSSAVGRYQITQTTLRDLREKFGLRGDQLYDEKMQDHLFKLRLDQQGGPSQDNLASVWASVPDSQTGRSHYGQRTGATSEQVQQVLRQVPSAAQVTPLVAPSAQGAPMALNTGSNSSTNDGKSTVRVEFGGDLPRGMKMRLDNPQKVDVGGPLVERPQLLGAMP